MIPDGFRRNAGAVFLPQTCEKNKISPDFCRLCEKHLQNRKIYGIIIRYYCLQKNAAKNQEKRGTYMELDLVKYLAKLGKLSFTDEELEQAVKDMTSIIEIMDTIKEIDIAYDPLKDNHNVYLKDLRKDEAKPSLPTEKLLQNAVQSENCFVVPKVVE